MFLHQTYIGGVFHQMSFDFAHPFITCLLSGISMRRFY